jgi:hypothetical protein
MSKCPRGTFCWKASSETPENLSQAKTNTPEKLSAVIGRPAGRAFLAVSGRSAIFRDGSGMDICVGGKCVRPCCMNLIDFV